MSLTFSGGDHIRSKAKGNLETWETQVRRWWTERYNLPPNHELFQSLSIAEHTLDMYEDLYFKKEEVERALTGRGGGDKQSLMEQLSALNRALGLSAKAESEDELVDQWERDIEEGRVPDLDL